MSRLRFIQSGWPVSTTSHSTTSGSACSVSSNAGGFSVGVAEFALALDTLGGEAGGQARLFDTDRRVRPRRLDGLFHEVVVLKGRTMGDPRIRRDRDGP